MAREIISFPIKDCDLNHSYVSLPEGQQGEVMRVIRVTMPKNEDE